MHKKSLTVVLSLVSRYIDLKVQTMLCMKNFNTKTGEDKNDISSNGTLLGVCVFVCSAYEGQFRFV